MKSAVLALALLFAVLQVDARYLATEDVDVYEQECLKELNINKDNQDPAKHDELKLCYFRKSGVLLSNGDIDYDKLLEQVIESIAAKGGDNSEIHGYMKDKVTEAAEECRASATETHESVIDTINQAIKCVESKSAEKLFGR